MPYKYDVAFSCLHEDEPVARQLFELLEDRVKSMFLFTQNQKDALGEDGAEFFRQTYGKDSRIVVVIYREGWGLTRWTGIEDRTIRDLYLNHNVRRVLVYSVDKKTPSWLPETYLWASDQVGGLRDLAVVIARKVQEEGGDTGLEDVVTMAQRLAQKQAGAERREARRASPEALNAANREVEAAVARLAEQARAIEAGTPGLVVFRDVGGYRSLLSDYVGAMFLFEGGSGNSIRGGKLNLHMTRGPMDLYRGWQRENSRIEIGYELHLAEDEATWLWFDADGRSYSSIDVGDAAVRRFLREDHKRREARLRERQRGR